MSGRPLLAVFVGGKSRRMGEPKGRLPAPESSEPILEVLALRGREAGFDLALVGDAAPYADLAAGVPRIEDDPPGAGPLGGLHGALRHAVRENHPVVVAIACDMPYVTVEALTRLSSHPSGALVLAARRDQHAPWEPMLARYDAARLVDVLAVAIANGERSFQGFFASIEVDPLPLGAEIERALQDWDTPEDIGAR
jgi:molybdopterin-guanine dinucleotide biosynthesis protein A